MYWCEPDPKDTVGSEQEKDRIWVIVSRHELHRGNCVGGVPLTTQTKKAVAHLVGIPAGHLTMGDGTIPQDCVAPTDQIRALDKTRLRRRAGYISKQGLSSILFGLQRLFGMDD
ncbi:MAG: type II toxin-antitoxin system PemK/MazF family toxin [Thermodesulfovibrionales bacterium]|jgi:mRNA-degrading endonuclease toxin of MazEF toxin-antitoxin module